MIRQMKRCVIMMSDFIDTLIIISIRLLRQLIVPPVIIAVIHAFINYHWAMEMISLSSCDPA